MFRPYDHRFGSAFSNKAAWFQQGHTTETTSAQHQNPEFAVLSRWWARSADIVERQKFTPAMLAFRNIARSTDTRTFLSSFIPYCGVINSAPYMEFGDIVSWRLACCLLANCGTIALDFVVRNKLGGTNVNFFIVEQLPIFAPVAYAKPSPWSRKKTTLETWISERVLKLTCTAEDMLPLAEACDFTAGSFKKEYGGRLNKWDEAERAQLMAELDAAYFHLYGISREDAEYILSTFKGIHDRNPLFPDSGSTADHILATYDAFAST